MIKSDTLVRRPDNGGTKGQITLVKNRNHLSEIFQYSVSIEKEILTKVGDTTKVIVSSIFEKSHLSLLQKLNAQEKLFKNYAYDGRSILYSTEKINVHEKMFVFEFSIDNEPPAVYYITLQLTKNLKLDSLTDYLEGKKSVVDRELMPAFDLFIRNGPIASGLFPLRDTFYRLKPIGSLGGIAVAREGFFSSTRLVQAGFLLNLNLSTGPFIESTSLLDVVCRLFRINDYNQLSRTEFGRREANTLERYLKGVTINVKNPKSYTRKIKVEGISNTDADHSFFEKDYERMSVSKYYQINYNISLQFGNCLCVIRRNSLFPLELCTITADQFLRNMDSDQTAKLIKFASMRPREKMNKINQCFRELDIQQNSFFHDVGLRCSSSMLECKARILPVPKLSYSREVQVQNGKWNLRNVKLHSPSTLNNWIVLSTARCNIADAKALITNLIRAGSEMGMKISPPFSYYASDASESAIKSKLEEISRQYKLSFIFCIVDGSTNTYRILKRLGDSQYGFASQCILYSNLKKASSPQFLGNLILKINAKLGGTNQKIMNLPKISNRLMVVGADVTHPSGGGKAEDRPSIVAVVASRDANLSHYTCLIAQQNSRVETIENMKHIMKELLRRYRDENKVYPEAIVMIRDGVSEGELKSLYFSEVANVMAACSEISMNYKPTVTFLVAQKRTKIRIFPTTSEGQDRSENLRAGTVIDTTICHPNDFDFYMQTHAGIQGTTVPVHYYVIVDDNKFTSDQIQEFLNGLSGLNARSTTIGSVAVPAFYAHLAAARGRLLSHVDMDESFQRGSKGKSKAGMYEVHSNISGRNFFL